MAQAEIQKDAVTTDAAAKKKLTMALVAIFSAYFVAQLYMQGLNVVQPIIAADLNGMALYAWGVSMPGLASAIATLIFGKLSDIYGRNKILTVSFVFFLIGSIIGALSPTFVVNVVARFVIALGQGALMPLAFAVIGDLFDPVQRSKWSGLLNIPAGICAFFGPTLAGILADKFSWPIFFWMFVPLTIISLVLIFIGVPGITHKMKHKIDYVGAILIVVASALMILGFSWGGVNYPWASVQIIGLLGASVALWAFFVWYEGKHEEPMLDPQILTNRTFMTAAVAGFMSFFGLLAIMMYYPLYAQGVLGVSATVSGNMYTPFAVLMAFMGVPAGIMLGKTKKYKWMYIAGYAILAAAMFGMITFNQTTPVWLTVLITSLAGFGLGLIPTVNTLVAQFAVPRRLMGVAIGAIFFFVMMGMAICPSILGSVMNSSYAGQLSALTPAGLSGDVMAAISNPQALFSPAALSALETSIGDAALFDQTIGAVRTALTGSLKSVFTLGAITMAIAFLMIVTIPQISLDAEVEDKRAKGK